MSSNTHTGLRQLSADESISLIEPAALEDVHTFTTDCQLDALLKEYATLTQMEGGLLDLMAVREHLMLMRKAKRCSTGPALDYADGAFVRAK